MKLRWLATLRTIPAPGLNLGEGNPTGIVAPLKAAVPAVNAVFSHGSGRRSFLTFHSVMGLTKAMHHVAIRRVADQITTVADRINA